MSWVTSSQNILSPHPSPLLEGEGAGGVGLMDRVDDWTSWARLDQLDMMDTGGQVEC